MMFNWFKNLFAETAFNMAVYSAGLASACGMHQPKEPDGLKELAEEKNNRKNVVK